AHLAALRGSDELLRQLGPQVRRARRGERQLQPAADAVRAGQVRDVVRRDGGGDLHRDHIPGRLQADRVRPGSGEQDQVLGLAVDLGAGHPAGRVGLRCSVEVRVLGYLQAVRLAGRAEVRLVRGPAGYPDLAVQQPRLQEGRCAVRGHHAGIDQLDRPGAPDPEPGPVHRHPVRGHPAVREPGPDGRPAGRRGDRRHGEREPGAAGWSVRRVAVHPGAVVRLRLARTVSRARRRGPAHWARPVVAHRKKGVSVTLLEDLAPPPEVEVKPRAVSRRERWQLRLPLLPALIYTIVVTLMITPFLVMPVAAALVWAGPMLDPQFGLVNYLLQPFGVHHVAWLSTHALGSVILVMIWQWTPFMMLIVLAGLQSQPSDTLEAAKVDGA